MNGFKKFGSLRNNEIHFKILYKDEADISTLEFVLSYPDKDIWGEGVYGDFINGRMYYKKIYLHRDIWAKMKSYSNVSMAIEDFNNAISEFKNTDNWQVYKNEVNIYLIGKANEVIKNIK